MKKLIACIAVVTGILGCCVTAGAREVTTLDLDCGNDTKAEVIQGVVEEPETVSYQTTDKPEITEAVEPKEETEPEFTGNYDSSDEDEWVDMEPEDCPGHIWEHSYDDSEDETVYFRFCLNCGYTEYLDGCPEELAYTLSDCDESDDEEETIFVEE